MGNNTDRIPYRERVNIPNELFEFKLLPLEYFSIPNRNGRIYNREALYQSIINYNKKLSLSIYHSLNDKYEFCRLTSKMGYGLDEIYIIRKIDNIIMNYIFTNNLTTAVYSYTNYRFNKDDIEKVKL